MEIKENSKFLEIKIDRNIQREIFKNLVKRFLIRVLYDTRFNYKFLEIEEDSKFLEIKIDRNIRREIFKNLAKRFLTRVLRDARFD